MGFHKIAKYYYYPGWHEPCANLELIINRDAYQKLPVDLKRIISSAAKASNDLIISAFDVKNVEYYHKLKYEENVNFRKYPNDVILKLKTFADEVIKEISDSDEMSKKIYDSYRNFHESISVWHGMSEQDYI